MIKKSTAAALALFGTLGALHAADYTLDTISVESSTIRNTAAGKTEVSAVDFIDEAQIKEMNPKQISEVLKTIPGMTADVRGNEVVEIHIRGLNQQEYMWEDTGVAIIVDGVPVYAKSGKFRINMSDITSIKVIKGSASYLYGNNATAGAVIITTSKPRGVEDSYMVRAEAGSYNSQDYEATARINRETFGVSLNANYRTTDGYWTDAENWSKSLSGKFSYYIDDTSDVTLSIDKTLKYEQQKRASSTGVSAADANPRGSGATAFQYGNDVDLDKYILSYSKSFANGGNLLASTYYYLDNYDYISSPKDTDGDMLSDTYSRHSLEDKRQQGIKVEYKQELERLAYMVGYEFGDRQYETASETLIDYSEPDDDEVMQYYYAGEKTGTDDNQRLHAFYGELKYAITPALTAVFNARHDIQKDMYNVVSLDYNGTGWTDGTVRHEHTFHENAYRVGATYVLSPAATLFTSVATGYRTPTVDKMVKNYEGRGRTGGVAEDIDVQTTMTYELGARGNVEVAGNAFGYEASLFQVDNRDIIGYRYGTYSMSTSGGITDNIGDARNRGFELMLKSDPARAFSFNLAYTYLTTEYTAHDLMQVSRGGEQYDVVGNELPRTPNHVLDLYATYRVTPALKFIGELYTQSGHYADETNMIEMPGYGYVNMQVRYTTDVGKNELELYARVNNVFDKHYYQTAFFTSDKSGDGTFDVEDPTITVAPGTEFFAGLIFHF